MNSIFACGQYAPKPCCPIGCNFVQRRIARQFPLTRLELLRSGDPRTTRFTGEVKEAKTLTPAP